MPVSGVEHTKIRKILVIGANGFIGSYIVKKCIQQGFDVTATYRKNPDPFLTSTFGNQVTWRQLDIMNLFDVEESTKGMDAVINTAAVVSFNPKKKKEGIRVGIEGTANIVNAALENNISKFVHISSVAAIGRKKVENHINETDIFSHSGFDTDYGLSKFLAEQEVWRAHYEGLPVTILNPSMVIGAGPWGQSSTKLITSIYEGLRYYPVGTTGFVDVRDIADAAMLTLQDKFDGQRFIISAQNLSFEKVFSQIAQNLTLSKTLKPLTPNLASFAWRWSKLVATLTGKEPVITKDNAKSTGTISWYDNTKSTEILGLQYRDPLAAVKETCSVFLAGRNKNHTFDMLEF
jgi:nucleoside-diphosphate-sugar epimerase